jgi:VanZ family protein
LMDKREMRKKWWTIFAVYVVFIYATLGIAPTIWDAIDSFLGGNIKIPIYVLGFTVFLFTLLYLILKKKERDPQKYLLYLLFVWVFLVLNKITKFPSEKIHLMEYAGMGVMLYNALKIDIDRFDRKLYIFGGVICLFVGFLEEVIQLLLPNRYFDLRDVFINVVSGVTALLAIRYVVLKEEAGRGK